MLATPSVKKESKVLFLSEFAFKLKKGQVIYVIMQAHLGVQNIWEVIYILQQKLYH